MGNDNRMYGIIVIIIVIIRVYIIISSIIMIMVTIDFVSTLTTNYVCLNFFNKSLKVVEDRSRLDVVILA